MAGAPQKDGPLQSFSLNAKGTLPKDGMLTKDKIQVSAAAARWNGTKKKFNSDRRHSLCNSDTTPVGNSFSVEATLEELAPAQRTEIAKRHWHESF